MTMGIAFWVVYILAFVLGLWSNYDAAQPLWYRRAGSHFILWVLVGVLGYKVFPW